MDPNRLLRLACWSKRKKRESSTVGTSTLADPASYTAEKQTTKKRKFDAAEANLEYLPYSGKVHMVLGTLKTILNELQPELDAAASGLDDFAAA